MDQLSEPRRLDLPHAAEPISRNLHMIVRYKPHALSVSRPLAHDVAVTSLPMLRSLTMS